VDKSDCYHVIFRFLVRDFVYDEKELAAGKNEISKLESTKKKQFVCDEILFHARNYLNIAMFDKSIEDMLSNNLSNNKWIFVFVGSSSSMVESQF